MARQPKRAGPFRWLRSIPHSRYLGVLAIVFAAVWALAAIAPRDRGVWALENLPVAALVGAIALFRRRLLLSRISYTLVLVFLCMHEIGAHYTYQYVPYDRWLDTVFGSRLGELVGWERNNFDRVVHFSYGLLLAYPIREMFLRVADVRGFWGYFLPLDLTMSSSMFYELLEWAVAAIFGGGSAAYIGTQGDPWDAHKDMALASLGALLSMTVNALLNWRLQHDFAREWAASLRVKGRRPLGEDAAARLARR